MQRGSQLEPDDIVRVRKAAGLELTKIVRQKQFQIPEGTFTKLISLLNDKSQTKIAEQVIEAVVLSCGLQSSNMYLVGVTKVISLSSSTPVGQQHVSMAHIILLIIQDSPATLSEPAVKPFLHFFCFVLLFRSAS